MWYISIKPNLYWVYLDRELLTGAEGSWKERKCTADWNSAVKFKENNRLENNNTYGQEEANFKL